MFFARVRKWFGMMRMWIYGFWECGSDGKHGRCSGASSEIVDFGGGLVRMRRVFTEENSMILSLCQ